MNKDYNNLSHRATLCEDGKYRWIYNMNLFKNPTVFLLILKIFLIIFAVGFSLMMIFDAVNFKAEYPDRLFYNLKFGGYFLAGTVGLCLAGYLIYAAIMGGKYTVIFEMDENGVNHIQIPSQAKKAKRIAGATFAAGAVGGSITTMGIGINAQRTEMYSEFSKVKKVKAYPHRRLIKVNVLLNHNQVYTAKEDFDFVSGYISAHCQNAVK